MAQLSQSRFWGFSIISIILGGSLFWYILNLSRVRDTSPKILLDGSADDDDDDKKEASEKKESSKGGTKSKSSTEIKEDAESTTPPSSNANIDTNTNSSNQDNDNNNTPPSQSIQQQVQDIDKRGKTLFKEKKFLEAATTFTEAIDLIQTAAPPSSPTTPPELAKYAITLLNNRAAMYEKGNLPDLSLHDCDTLLATDPTHTKARTRRLRILESQERYKDALTEVCAMQLQFMQMHKDQMALGIPMPTPPVSQSKVEELVMKIVPGEVEERMERIKKVDVKEKRLPGKYTVLQLLKSFDGYTGWMSDAAREGNVRSLGAKIAKLDKEEEEGKEEGGDESSATTAQKTSSVSYKAQRATLYMKRGRRFCYDKDYTSAKDEFEKAYSIVEKDDEVIKIMQDDFDGAYARLLEWMGLFRHLRYDLASASSFYSRCGEFEPTNTEILVKRAGVKMDGGEYPEAHDLFDTALALDSASTSALLHRSNLYVLQSKPDKAKADLQQCLKLRPDHNICRLRLATVLMSMNNLDEANKLLDESERYDPESSEVYAYRGETLYAKGELEEAKALFRKAAELDSWNPAPSLNLALVIMNSPVIAGGLPDIAEAIKYLEKAIEIDPLFHSAYVHLGQLKLGMATNLDSAREVVGLYDRGLECCRMPEELKDLVSLRLLTVAQIDAAASLKMETLSMQ